MVKKHIKNFFEFIKSDFFFIFSIMFVNLLVCFVLFKTLPFGDTSHYAHMTRVILEDHSIFQHDFYSYFSILLSIVNIPAFLLFRNEFLSIRVTVLLIHFLIAPVFFILFRKILGRLAKPLTMLLLLNPLLIFFSGVYSWAEGLTTLLAIIAFYFFFRREKLLSKDYFLFGLFSGLAVLARTSYLLFVWPFCLFLLYDVYKDCFVLLKSARSFNKGISESLKRILSLSLVILPYLFWLVIQKLMIVGAGDKATNYFKLVIDLMSSNAGTVFSISLILTSFIALCSVGMLILFGPIVLIILFRIKKPAFNKLSLTLFAFFFLIIFHSFWYTNEGINLVLRLRYLTPYIGVGFVAIGLFIKEYFLREKGKYAVFCKRFSIKLERKNVLNILFSISIIFFLFSSLIIDFTFLNANLTKITPSGKDYVLLYSRNVFDAANWMNDNIVENSDVVLLIQRKHSDIGLEYFIPDLLRSDLKIHISNTTRPFGNFKLIGSSDNLSGFYILSDEVLTETSVISKSSIRELYSTRKEPVYHVYFYSGNISDFSAENCVI